MKAIIDRRQPEPASLCSFIHTMLSMCNCAHLNGHEVYVDWTQYRPGFYADETPGLPANMWDWYLEQPMLAERPSGVETWTYWDPSWRRRCPVQGDLPWNAIQPQAVAVLQHIVPKFMKFKPQVIEGAESLFKTHNLDPANTIGISYRGTDKKTEAVVAPPEAFFKPLDQVIARNPHMKVWVKAEEEAASQIFLNRYPQAVVMREFFNAPGNVKMADILNPKPGYQKGLDILVMLYMFSKCAVLLKNAANISDLAAGLSKGEIICVNPEKKANPITVSSSAPISFKF